MGSWPQVKSKENKVLKALDKHVFSTHEMNSRKLSCYEEINDLDANNT